MIKRMCKNEALENDILVGFRDEFGLENEKTILFFELCSKLFDIQQEREVFVYYFMDNYEDKTITNPFLDDEGEEIVNPLEYYDNFKNSDFINLIDRIKSVNKIDLDILVNLLI